MQVDGNKAKGSRAWLNYRGEGWAGQFPRMWGNPGLGPARWRGTGRKGWYRAAPPVDQWRGVPCSGAQNRIFPRTEMFWSTFQMFFFIITKVTHACYRNFFIKKSTKMGIGMVCTNIIPYLKNEGGKSMKKKLKRSVIPLPNYFCCWYIGIPRQVFLFL